MTLPLISVIIPSYNNSATIKRTINSVLYQTVQKFEILIVDDFSDDLNITEKVLFDFDDSRIKLIKHQKNKKGGAARNTGVKSAKGKFIAFLDADDEWLPNHLEESLKTIQHQKTKDCLIYSKEKIITHNHPDVIVPKRGLNKSEDVTDYLICNDGFIQTSSFFSHRELFLENPFDEELIRYQDYDLIFKLKKSKCDLIFSNHLGVILHWENTDQEKKGATIEYSLNWAKERKHLFTRKSYACFIFSRAIIPFLSKGKRLKALRLLFLTKRVNFTVKKIYIFICYFIFKGIPKFLSK